MIWIKTSVLFSGLIIASFLISWQTGFGIEAKPAVTEIKTQMSDVSPEVREKAFGLLNEVLVESETLKSQSSKLQMQLEIADLLWEKDEAKARKVFQSFVSETGKEDCRCELLTEENIQKIANRDAKIAMQIRYFVPAGETMDVIFETFLKQYPEENLEKSKASLANNFAGNFFRKSGYESYNEKRKGILDRLELIYAQNSKNGADFAGAILAKLKDNKLNVRYIEYNANLANQRMTNVANYSNSNTYSVEKYAANSPINSVTNKMANLSFSNSNSFRNTKINDVDFSKVREFFEMAIASKESAAKGQTPMLTESELGDLAKMMVNALIASKKFNSSEVQGTYETFKKYALDEMTKLEKSLTPNQAQEIKKPREQMFKLPSASSDSDAKDKIPIPPNETPVGKAEREFVDNVRYISKITNHCNIEEDAIIFAGFQNKGKYPDMVEYFENYMPVATAKIGNIKELRKYVEKESSNSEKIKLLSFAADAVTTQNDKNDLAELLKETKISVPQQYKNVTEFNVLMNYAKILSATSPSRSFDFLESLLNDANKIINSAAIVAEFSEDESQENGEFRFTKMQEQIAKKSSLTIGLIKKLAHFDFERTKKLADKFARPEARLFIKWHIANSLLNKNAPTEEAKFYEVEVCG